MTTACKVFGITADYDSISTQKAAVISAVIDALPTSDPLRTGRAVRWCVDSFRLWWRAPWRLLVLAVAIFVVEGLLQMVPWVGLTLSKVTVPMLALGFILGLDALARSGSMGWASLFDAFRGGRVWSASLLVLFWAGSVFAAQQLCIAWVYVWPGVDALWLSHIAARRAMLTANFQYLVLLSGVPMVILLGLAPTLFLFGDRSPWQACAESVRFVLHHPAPFALLALINLALQALALSVPMGALLLIAMSPVPIAGAYVIWRDAQPRIVADV